MTIKRTEVTMADGTVVVLQGNERLVPRGLGDTVAGITEYTGMGKLAQLFKVVTGKDCGCTSRQEALNKLFPYGIKETE